MGQPGRFRARDLASLQEQIDEYVDEMMIEGAMGWRCEIFGTYVPQDDGPDCVEWNCEVTENPHLAKRRVA